ncbi:MAG: hypothetical protein CMJ65_13345 [Planctomycetaceae bacterium]|nr:hypothetical protein [Planctomycetaceae bacterium]
MIVLVGVALLAPGAGAGDPVTASRSLPDPGVAAAWRRLDESLRALQQQIDELASQQGKAVTDSQQQVSRSQQQLKSDLQNDIQRMISASLGRDHQQWLLQTIRSELGSSQGGIKSIERKLEELTRTVQLEAADAKKTREALEKQLPVLAVTVGERRDRFTILARRVPLADVLAQLGELSRWQFTATPAARTPVSIARLADVTVEEALEVLLPAAGCAAKLEGRRVFVMSVEAARQERQRLKAAAKRL